jgi:mono/diheme cytochrome c family protein
MNPAPRSALAAAVLAVAVLVGCGQLFPHRSEGEKLWRKQCADCHGLRAAGNTVQYMGNSYADLTDSNWKYGGGDKVSITNSVRGGVFLHPNSLRQLTDAEINSIIDYLRELRGEKPPTVPGA